MLDWNIIVHYFPFLAKGALLTLEISILSLILGLIFGLSAALGKLSRNFFLRNISAFYIWLIRSTPLLVQLFIIYFGLPQLGIDLGLYRSRDIDCRDAKFRFANLPEYACPVEIEERSSGFLSRHHARHRRQRIVVLCMEHDAPTVLQGYVDVLELRELSRSLSLTA